MHYCYLVPKVCMTFSATQKRIVVMWKVQRNIVETPYFSFSPFLKIKKKGNSKVGLRRHELKFPRFVGFQTCLFTTTCNSMILSKTCFDIMFSRLKMEGLVSRYQESNHSLKVFCTCFKSTSTSINHHLKLWH